MEKRVESFGFESRILPAGISFPTPGLLRSEFGRILPNFAKRANFSIKIFSRTHLIDITLSWKAAS